MVDGADCDWPGPDYETIEPESDLRHPGAKKTNGKVYPGVDDPDEPFANPPRWK